MRLAILIFDGVTTLDLRRLEQPGNRAQRRELVAQPVDLGDPLAQPVDLGDDLVEINSDCPASEILDYLNATRVHDAGANRSPPADSGAERSSAERRRATCEQYGRDRRAGPGCPWRSRIRAGAAVGGCDCPSSFGAALARRGERHARGDGACLSLDTRVR